MKNTMKMDSRSMAKEGMQKMHSIIMTTAGESPMMMADSGMPHNNPLTSSGKKVMEAMHKQYGSEKGKKVFYATMNKQKQSKWHK